MVKRCMVFLYLWNDNGIYILLNYAELKIKLNQNKDEKTDSYIKFGTINKLFNQLVDCQRRFIYHLWLVFSHNGCLH